MSKKLVPGSPFQHGTVKIDQNVLSFASQPDEEFSLRMLAKIRGDSFCLEPVKWIFIWYPTVITGSFWQSRPEVVHVLLLDAMSGDATLLMRAATMSEEAWDGHRPIGKRGTPKKDAPEL